MSKMLPLRGIAALICSLDGLSGEAVERVTQQMRGLHGRGLLSPASAGARDAWLFDVYEACRARILLELIDLGLAGEAIQRALNAFDFDVTKGAQRSTMLAAAMTRAAKGEECTFKVEIFNKPGASQKELSAGFEWPGMRTKAAERILAAARRDEKRHAVITLPATDLLRPVIQKFSEA